MGHVVLLGDSIFDNARYVPDRPPVVEQVRRSLPPDWHVTLLAVDGHTSEDVPAQLRGMPVGASHLVVSAGGNDALGESMLLSESVHSVGEALGLLHEARERFRATYRTMLRALVDSGKPAAVCTVYDSIPGFGAAELTALAGFNEVILREAVAHGMPVVDLRLVCKQPSDYSPLSPIEPSMTGGAKIARLIADLVTSHDFTKARSVIYR